VGETTETVLKTPDDLRAMLSRGEIVSVTHVAAIYRGLEELAKQTNQ
jgi:hypothetical protein